MLQKTLALNIKRLREKRSLSQMKLAELAGVSVDTIELVETCKRWPHARRLTAIAKALSVTPLALFKPIKKI